MNVFTQAEIAGAYDAYYETPAGSKVNQIEEKLITEALQKIQKGKMLELGCGTGHWTKIFVDKGFDVVATDISDAMLKFAHQKNIGAEIIKADSEDLPFNKESFDVVASVTMMEFVNSKDRVLDEIDKVLKPGGWLLLGCLNGNSELGKNAANDPVFKNAAFFSPESLQTMLERFGRVEITSGVHYSSSFELTDNTNDQKNYEPAFLVALVQKAK